MHQPWFVKSLSPFKPFLWNKNSTIIWSNTRVIFLGNWVGWFYLYNLIKSAFDTDPVTSKYSLSVMVFNAEIPLLIGPNEKRHSRGTRFQTQSNNNRLKQLLSAVPSIIYQKLYPLDNVWLFKQTPSGLLQSNAPGETQAWKVRRRKQHEQ